VITTADSGSLLYNYKNYFAVVLFGVCGYNFGFTFVDIGSYGKSSGSIDLQKLTSVKKATSK